MVTGGVHSIYGVSILSDVNIYDIEQDANNLSISNGAIEFDFNSHRFIIPAYGIHNASNALLAIGSAIIAGIEIDQIKHGLSKFSGVKRRFTTIGNLNGITFIDDYAHHPSEIIATLLAARSITSGRIIGVIQPHRFSRVQLFFKDFVNAFDLFDFVILLDVYSAGEQSIDGCFSRDLIKSAQNPKVFYSENNSPSIKDKLITLNLNSGDFVIFMGAGTISEVSYKVFAELSPHDYSQHFLC